MRPSASVCSSIKTPAAPEIYTLSLHDALPISGIAVGFLFSLLTGSPGWRSSLIGIVVGGDRKSTRLNSSHSQISYAVFCLKKKRDDDGVGERAETGEFRDDLLLAVGAGRS